jgi:RNA polymerase sigma-70 factor (ECF subfamily)
MNRSTSRSTAAAGFACVRAAWAAHEAELRGYLRHQLADDHAAEDLLQDVFIKAMRQDEGFCVLDNPRAWLFQVARNALVDRARMAKPHIALDEIAHAIEAPRAEPIAPLDALAGCVARVLGELSADDAAILRPCDLEGMTQREFAQRHGLSLPASKSRLLRARQRMRDRLTTACQVRFDDDGCVSSHVPRPNPAG